MAETNEHAEALAAKGRLLLTVELSTADEADELMRWMYSKTPPMKARLLEIAWDKEAVPKAMADAINAVLAAART